MKKLIILAAAIMLSAGAAQAKWWIFGKANADVSLKYVYVNKIPADETGSEIKLFKEALPPDGSVKITGKAALGKGGVGSIRISLDGKATWQDVKFAEDGTFEHSFKPEAGKTYTMLIEVTDTAGKTNTVEDTRKQITLSTENVQAKVREALDALCDAYNKEDVQRFMTGVGENFTGDKNVLERAVKKDFDALNNISLRYTLNNLAAGAQGRIYVSITYNRMVFVNKTGASSTDSGVTEFVFDTTGGMLTLYSMKQPLIFGLSDADNVATGTVLGSHEALTLNDAGTIGEIIANSAVLNNYYTGCPGSCAFASADTFTFDTETVGTTTSQASFAGDFVFNSGVMFMNSGGEIKDLGMVSLDSVAQVTDSGWEALHHIGPNNGHTYAMKLPGGKFALVYVTNYDTTNAAAHYVLHFDYKYNSGGGRSF